MIRYDTTENDLTQKINASNPNWLKRAKKRTTKFINAGAYDEKSGIWSEIKEVYMALQHDKCAYCERQLADADLGGTIEHDVEHFRPKNSVPVWPNKSTAELRNIKFEFDLGKKLDKGYFWLAYNIMNYCISCKKCNSPLKKNNFPIARNRGKVSDTPQKLNETEKPYLIYPLGKLDEDPEEIITFDGVVPIPKKQNGPRWRRAKVTIRFFELDTREELIRERARCLVNLDNALIIVESNLPEQTKAVARTDIVRLRSPKSPHSSCVRAACDAYIEDPDRMRKLFQAAREYLDS
ncbi:hypothetical protein Pan153_62730 [Gimesia panareensis]|uniref:HNH nuclease domain-containing protein n=1 Tax=Gimesia panareensis TaxID=2527978 RepID=A0A518FZ08_9PLAN|nr:hypothetical protein [Gimesia panareensis]QDV21583.1 hypothetical protein Pan153_62730 [Gimesia panareensis]